MYVGAREGNEHFFSVYVVYTRADATPSPPDVDFPNGAESKTNTQKVNGRDGEKLQNKIAQLNFNNTFVVVAAVGISHMHAIYSTGVRTSRILPSVLFSTIRKCFRRKRTTNTPAASWENPK